MKLEEFKTDLLIVGAGGAGLSAAIEAKKEDVDVLVLSKMQEDGHSCTVRAWGGFTYSSKQTETG